MCKGCAFIFAHVKIIKSTELHFITRTQIEDLVYLTFYFDVFHTFFKGYIGFEMSRWAGLGIEPHRAKAGV